MDSFRITSGTVVGREHVRLARNNQDGIGIAVDDDIIAAVVTDGCSEGRSSECGAKLAAAWLAAWAPTQVRACELDPERFVPALSIGLLRHLDPFVRGLSASSAIDPAVVQEFFLFTFLMVVITGERATIFGTGDGLFAIDGRTIVLEAGPENAPDYVGYQLLPGVAASDPVIHFDAPLVEVRSILLATDGAASLSLEQLEADSNHENPSWLHKRLNALGAVRGLLTDDTSMVLIRRR